MDIIVTGRKTTVTDALRDYVEEKIGGTAKVFEINPLSADVVLRVEKNPANPNPATCEVTLQAKGAVIRVSESDPDMYAAIDKAANNVSRQLRKFKTKIVDRRQIGADSIKNDPKFSKPTSEWAQDLMDELNSEQDDDSLVREKIIDFTVLTEEEALVQTDLIGHDFFVFTNAETGLTNVIYHRKNGGYGIIKPRIESEEG